MKATQKLAILAGLMLSFAGISSASPIITMTYNATFDGNTSTGLLATDWTMSGRFQRFNSSFGSLSGVRFNITGNVLGSVTATASPTSGYTQEIETQVAAILSLSVPNHSTLDLFVEAPIYTDRVAPGASISRLNQTASGSLSSEVFSDGATLAFVAGTGKFAADLSGYGMAYIFGDSFYGEAVTAASGTASVTYYYTPYTLTTQNGLTPNPEPGTWLLLGGALVSAFLLRRRFATIA